MDTYEIWKLAEKDLLINLNDDHKENQLRNYMSQYFIADESINRMKQQFEIEITNGLTNSEIIEVQDPTELGMKVTFYTELFNGAENGKCIVMYLNNRHLILILAKIKPGFPVELKKEYFMVSESIRRSPYMRIFEFLCDCLLKFFSEQDLLGKTQTVGFCSDFPLILYGIDHCIVWYFTPSAADFPLNCYDVKKCFDIVLLKERYKDLKLNLVTFLNDNTSRLMHLSYTSGQIDILLNLANDCDIVYWEEVVNIKKWRSAEEKQFEKVLIDSELRNFGGGGFLDCLMTDLEWATVSSTIKCHRHTTVDRFICQPYILELMKLVLADLHHNLLYCRHSNIQSLQEDGISLVDLCAFANCEDMDHAAALLPGKSVGGSVADAKVAKYVCNVLLVRAAILTAVCLASFMARSRKDELVVAVDCPLLKKHCNYETYIRNVVKRLAPEKKFQFVWTEESGVCEGAALGTIIASRLDSTDLRF